MRMKILFKMFSCMKNMKLFNLVESEVFLPFFPAAETAHTQTRTNSKVFGNIENILLPKNEAIKTGGREREKKETVKFG